MKEHIAHMVRDRATRFGQREVFRYRDKKENVYRSYNWNEFTHDADKVSRALISLGFGHGSGRCQTNGQAH